MGNNVDVLQIDEEQAIEFYEQSSKKAEDLLKDPDKMEKFLQKLEKKLKTVPGAGNALAYVPVMISLVRNYVKKEYTDIPVTSIVAIIIALLYFLSPVDLIPDGIPGIGYLDDAAVISGCIALIRTDLEDYRIWRKENGYEIEDIPEYEDIYEEAKNNNTLLNAFFRGKKSATAK